MAADISAMTDLAEGGFVPDGARNLMEMLEQIPQLFEVVSAGLHELASFMEGSGGTTLEDAGAGMHEAAKMAGHIFDTTSDIFLQVREDAGFWLDEA